MGGLKQGTDDYNWIYAHFWNGTTGFDVDSYDGEAIWKSPQRTFRDSYDLRQFKQSLKRMVTKITTDSNFNPTGNTDADVDMEDAEEGELPPPGTPGATAGSPPPSARRGMKSPPPAPRMASPPPAPREYVANDEYALQLPHHHFQWKDQSENTRTTLMILLPTGVQMSDILPRVEAGGTQVKLVLTWPSVLLDSKMPMFLGTSNGKPFYSAGHVKVTNFRDTVRCLKHDDETTVVKSVFRCSLPSVVEEQFCRDEVPEGAYVTVFGTATSGSAKKMASKCLFLEMMNLRTNYKGYGDVEEFDLDFESLTI